MSNLFGYGFLLLLLTIAQVGFFDSFGITGQRDELYADKEVL